MCPIICTITLFLSTLSLRRATYIDSEARTLVSYFYPRSPCGERPWARGSRVTYVEFLSTLSLRRATWARGSRVTYVEISIHALLAESDPSTTRRLTNLIISIHALLAESDHPYRAPPYDLMIFLSTLSLRRATPVFLPVFMPSQISIHALLAESDLFL